MIADALYDPVIVETIRYFGPEISHFFLPQFEDAIGRLVWSNSSSLRSLPMVFFMEADQTTPTLLRIWNITRVATLLHVGCVEL